MRALDYRGGCASVNGIVFDERVENASWDTRLDGRLRQTILLELVLTILGSNQKCRCFVCRKDRGDRLVEALGRQDLWMQDSARVVEYVG